MSLLPAILIGAETVNAVSIIRSLAMAGVEVHLLCRPDALPAHSRYARRIPLAGESPGRDAWADYLLGSESEPLRGAVLLACNDDGIEMLLDHREELAPEYVLDICDPSAQRCMLDKLATYREAHEAGVPTPRFWPASSLDQVRAQEHEYVYPLMLKPLYSHRFKRLLGGKYLMARGPDELLAAYERVTRCGLEVVLLEEIPGPDDLLCSYYTYLDDEGAPLFHFTKRIIRRYPEHEGFACYHITDANPEVCELGLRLFGHVGLKGVANVEFKRDPRDGQLKLIECNARFTAANGLLAASGYDLGLFVYNRLAGVPQPPLADRDYVKGLRLWYPAADTFAFLDLRRQGKLGFGQWLRSILHRQELPYFVWTDPVPSVVLLGRIMRRLAAENVRRVIPR